VIAGLSTAGPALLRRLDPERAHRLSIKALATGLVPADPAPRDPALAASSAACRAGWSPLSS